MPHQRVPGRGLDAAFLSSVEEIPEEANITEYMPYPKLQLLSDMLTQGPPDQVS